MSGRAGGTRSCTGGSRRSATGGTARGHVVQEVVNIQSVCRGVCQKGREGVSAQ